MANQSKESQPMERTRMHYFGLLCAILGWLSLAGTFLGYIYLSPLSQMASQWFGIAPVKSYFEIKNHLPLMLIASLLLAIAAMTTGCKREGLPLFIVGVLIGAWGVLINFGTALAGHGYPYFNF